MSKFTYGHFHATYLDASNIEHRQRASKSFTCASGEQLLPDAFAVILPKNTQVEEGKEFRRKFGLRSKTKTDLQYIILAVWCYHGTDTNPRWKDTDTHSQEMYTKLCTVKVDLSHIPLPPHPKANGIGTYYYQEYSLVLFFTSVELKAQIAWEENGVERRSPAEIVYDPDITSD